MSKHILKIRLWARNISMVCPQTNQFDFEMHLILNITQLAGKLQEKTLAPMKRLCEIIESN